MKRVSKRAGELGLVLLSIIACLVVLELVLQARLAWVRRQVTTVDTAAEETPLHIVLDEPIVYGLNPLHPDVSSQGLRNPEVVIPKPKNRKRILVLGDSVTFGTSVSREEAYPAQLEEILSAAAEEPIEVINAGVSGYSPFNQLQYYKTRGRQFEPDIVVVGFCMNDVANPRLHWDNAGESIEDIPEEAIPNDIYDRKANRKKDSVLTRSVLYATIKSRATRLFADETADAKVPTFITGEDPNLSIEVLVDQSSLEWAWLSSMYDQLLASIQEDGAQMMVVIFPLEYQLDTDYPHLPQQNLMEYCGSRSITSLDLLPRFRQEPFGDFFLEDKGVLDPWHLSKRGHHVTATHLAGLIRNAL